MRRFYLLNDAESLERSGLAPHQIKYSSKEGSQADILETFIDSLDDVDANLRVETTRFTHRTELASDY